MPTRSFSSPLQLNKESHSGIPKKKTGQTSRSAAGRSDNLNLTQKSFQRSHNRTDLIGAMTTQNDTGNTLLLTTQSGRISSGGIQSLGSAYCGSGGPVLTNPNGVKALNLDVNGFRPTHPSHLLDPAPKLVSSHSNATSVFCTPASASLTATHRDPANGEPQLGVRKKSPSVGIATQREEGRLIIRKAPLCRTAASKPNSMFNASPINTSLERVPTLSPQEASLERNETQQCSEAGTAAAKPLIQKTRTPSPLPQLHLQPQAMGQRSDSHGNNKSSFPQREATPATLSAAAVGSAAHTPAATDLTPSPRPLEPRPVEKPQKDVLAKALSRSSPPPRATSEAWSPPMNTHELPEYLPTDAPNVVVPARKFAYDTKTCAWKEIDTMIRVLHPNRGVSQGAMRVCFVVEELDERGFSTPMVAKMFRHNLEGIVEADYFNEGEAQCICGVFAEKYNKIQLPEEVDRFVISFLQCDTVRIRPKDLPEEYKEKRTGFFSYRTTDTRDIIFTMEPRLKGNFTKYTNNFGAVYEGFEQRLDNEKELRRHKVLMAVEAFSHFTLEDSDGSMLVCDLQGVNDFLTDPQIHTIDGKGLGMGNMGQRGIDAWVERHECNEVCRALKLTPLKRVMHQAAKPPNVETRVSYYRVLRSILRSQAPTRPEDLIPLPKPLSEMTDDERLEYAIRLSQLFS